MNSTLSPTRRTERPWDRAWAGAQWWQILDTSGGSRSTPSPSLKREPETEQARMLSKMKRGGTEIAQSGNSQKALAKQALGGRHGVTWCNGQEGTGRSTGPDKTPPESIAFGEAEVQVWLQEVLPL